MELIASMNLPFMMKGNAIMTINSWGTQHWAVKSKIKNQFKDLVKSWFLDDNVKLPKNIHFEWQPIYKDNRKKDAINVAPTIKVVEDSLVELGCLEDDDLTSHHIKVRIVDKTLSNHKLEVKIFTRND